MAETVYFSLGTNLGNRLANLTEAIKSLSAFCRDIFSSPVYETPPWGFIDQPLFLNQAVRAETDLEPLPLLTAIKSLAVDLGRQPNFLYGPRLIDIDILLYGSRVLQTGALTIPHPMLAQRAFVLVPLAEIAPGLVHPVTGKNMAALLAELDASGVKLVPNEPTQ